MMDNSNSRCTHWQLKSKTISFQKIPALMGIVNVTPDSFSDGGQFANTSAAVDHALKLAEEGADLLDIGGESTRPYATPIDVREELRRVIAVVEQICALSDVPVSIDTSKAMVAREAIAAGAEIINDVTGLQGDPDMINVALESGAGVCAMHAQGTPQTMQDNPHYDDVVEEIFAYLQLRKDKLIRSGIAPEKICLDPGIGFGKTHEHNLELIRNCERFLDLRSPILVGHSRKGFIAKIIGDKEADRTAATLGVSIALATVGVQVLRVHDIAASRQGLEAYFASLPITNREAP